MSLTYAHCHLYLITWPELVTRLLHQIHFVAQQAPLNSTSFAFVALLLCRVVDLRGITQESPQSDEAQEQLTLVCLCLV